MEIKNIIRDEKQCSILVITDSPESAVKCNNEILGAVMNDTGDLREFKMTHNLAVGSNFAASFEAPDPEEGKPSDVLDVVEDYIKAVVAV